ncbi:hypothetical protein [Sandaracinobacteroides saxicola]|uniref:Acyltransferase 3 domain-containing protein n=1 Tax=Sandaracinobacteroides saxicola TaxID=2759707 RepID=A0A7G5ILQ2_9SPHN|nr:hypothetical protein [Sandaracinobacteroides saxicola]QMW24294.1 hypothetical protein H3309_07535 [Sandaracinobacteroides saxicola]
MQEWSAITGLLGFAWRFWNHDHPWREPLTRAVFPAYIVHQTLIIIIAWQLRPAALPVAAEFALLVLLTAVGAALAWRMAERVPGLGLVLGVPRVSRTLTHAR